MRTNFLFVPMPAAQPHPEPAADPAIDPAAHWPGDAQNYRLVLQELVGIGLQLARRITPPTPTDADAATPAKPATTTTDDAANYERITRTVGRTVLLAHKIAQPLPAPKPAPGPAPCDRLTAPGDRIAAPGDLIAAPGDLIAAPGDLIAAPGDLIAARKRIVREVENTIQRTSKGDAADDRALRAELLERLDAPELDDDIAHRPVAEIIEEIRQDFGLVNRGGAHPFFQRRTPADLRTLHQQAARTCPPPPAPQPQAAQPQAAQSRTAQSRTAPPATCPKPPSPD